MIAALPMYDFPWIEKATDRLWAYIRDRLREKGVAAPQGLARGLRAQDTWSHGGLLLGQTCGYPYWGGLRRHVDILGTPIYGFAGCQGANHRSFLVAREGDERATLAEFRGSKAAVNGFDSNTGMNLFRSAVAPLAEGKPFFADVVETGAHAQSMVAVAEERADIAAIDCVSYALIARGASRLLAQLKIVGETAASPALPFIASFALPAATRAAVRLVLHELPPFPELNLTAIAYVPETGYSCIGETERAAVELGYPTLA